jgi:hypothetical protein
MPGGLGILVEQPSGHDQVPAHRLGVQAGQRAELGADCSIELVAGDVIRQRRLDPPRPALLATLRPSGAVRLSL